MSRRKRHSAANDIYSYHLSGGLKYNPAMHRELAIENMYIRVLTDLAVNRFKWEGLPDSINARYLEMTLFYQGLAIYFDDANLGNIVVKGSPNGYINYQGDPTGFAVTGNGNWHHAPVSAADAVPIWANYLRTPDIDIVMLFASRLAQMDRTLEINVSSMRQPKILKVPENRRLTMENVMRQVSEGQDVIRVTDDFDGNAIEVLDLSIDPDQLERLDIIQARQWGKCMGLLGIEYANQDKKERLVAAEVSANDEQTDSIKFVNLNARQQAADLINKKFGTDIKVDYNTAIAERADFVFNSVISSIESGATV